MPLDVILPIAVILFVALTAFAISAAIGLLIGRLGRREPADGGVALPAPRGGHAQD
jgi:hypothetical protein